MFGALSAKHRLGFGIQRVLDGGHLVEYISPSRCRTQSHAQHLVLRCHQPGSCPDYTVSSASRGKSGITRRSDPLLDITPLDPTPTASICPNVIVSCLHGVHLPGGPSPPHHVSHVTPLQVFRRQTPAPVTQGIRSACPVLAQDKAGSRLDVLVLVLTAIAISIFWERSHGIRGDQATTTSSTSAIDPNELMVTFDCIGSFTGHPYAFWRNAAPTGYPASSETLDLAQNTEEHQLRSLEMEDQVGDWRKLTRGESPPVKVFQLLYPSNHGRTNVPFGKLMRIDGSSMMITVK